MEMTRKQLVKICKDTGMYRSPDLNDVLYFHYKGFSNIAEIDEYVNARCLWLEGNAIEKIENLDALVQTRQLYLQENCIRNISGLDKLVNLVSLNLSNNFITRIENLDALTHLKTLHMKNNRLKRFDDIVHLLEVPSLETLDLTANHLEDEASVEVFEQMPNLLSLYVHQNPFCAKIRPYRKHMLGRCTGLRYLDDRPVFPDERRCVTAFVAGGLDAERKERETIRQEERDRNDANRRAFKQIIVQAQQETEALKAQGLAQPPNTEFHKTNFEARSPTAEDKWFTEQRERNKAKSEEVRRMEHEMLLRGGEMPGFAPPDRHADPAAAALPAADEAGCGDDAAAQETACPPSPVASGNQAADLGPAVPTEQRTSAAPASGKQAKELDPSVPTVQDTATAPAAESRATDPELAVAAKQTNDLPAPAPAKVPAAAPPAEAPGLFSPAAAAAAAAGADGGYITTCPDVHSSGWLLPKKHAPKTLHRPMVWGTPAYDALWKKALAATADDDGEDDGADLAADKRAEPSTEEPVQPLACDANALEKSPESESNETAEMAKGEQLAGSTNQPAPHSGESEVPQPAEAGVTSKPAPEQHQDPTQLLSESAYDELD